MSLAKQQEYYIYDANDFKMETKISLEEDVFLQLKKDRETLQLILYLEEQWECVIQNFAEFDQEILKLSSEAMISYNRIYEGMHDIRLTLARRLFNHLNSCSAYLDTTDLRMKALLGDSSVFKAIRHEAYEDYYGYRFMYNLRNYTHRDLPLHRVSFPSKWIENNSTGERAGKLQFRTSVGVNLNDLRESKFKQGVLEKFAGHEGRFVPILPQVKEQLEGLGQIHMGVRSALNDELVAAKAAYEHILNLYKESAGEDPLALCVAPFVDGAPQNNRVRVVTSIISRIERFQIKNGSLQNFTKRYVSNEIKEQE